MTQCPKCKQSARNNQSMVCDNDCGTVLCEFCSREYFTDENGKHRIGHAPWCGDSDSEFQSDESTSESYQSESGDSEDSYRENEDSNGDRSDETPCTSSLSSSGDDSYKWKGELWKWKWGIL